MSQCDRVLAILADGQPHPMREVHERAGTMRLNSRISELRKRGHVITCDHAGGLYVYTLSKPGSDPGEKTGTQAGSGSGPGFESVGGRESTSETPGEWTSHKRTKDAESGLTTRSPDGPPLALSRPAPAPPAAQLSLLEAA